ncbi:MAG: ATP-binding protein [Balneolaceae bacterium]
MCIVLFLAGVFPAPGVLQAQTDPVQEAEYQVEEELPGRERVDLLLELVLELNRGGEFEESRERLDEALELSDEIGYQEGYLRVLALYGDFYLNQGDHISALEVARQGLDASAGYPEMRMELSGLMANSYRMAGEASQAMRYYQDAIQLADSLDNEREVAVQVFNMTAAQKMLGDQSGALENLYESLQFAESEADSAFMAVILNNIGQSFNELQDYEQATGYLERSEELSRLSGYRTNLLRTLVNQGVSHAEMEDHDRASGFYLEALELAEEMGNFTTVIRVNYNLGQLELSRNNLELARDYFDRSMQESRDYNFQEGIIYNSIGYGELFQAREEYDMAGQWYEEARSLAGELQLVQLVARSMEGLYQTQRDAGNYPESLQWLEQLRELEDSLRTEERERMRSEFETRLNLHQSEEENQLLRLRQEEQEARIRYQRAWIYTVLVALLLLAVLALYLYRNSNLRKGMNRVLKERHREILAKNDELDRVNAVKDKMFAIIAHDLRGPLSSLQSLIYLLREYDLSKEELHEIIDSLEYKLHSNASTIDNLLAWAKSQMQGIQLDLRPVNLNSAARAVISQVGVQAEQKGVELTVTVPNKLEFLADYEAVKLILRNLLVNAVKFSNNGDRIELVASEIGDSVEVRVSDSGVGIPEKDQSRIFNSSIHSEPGTMREKGSGLGLWLCKEFVEKHGGSIRFESKVGEGTTFIFSLPLQPEPG